jgi:hypothetical protein
MPKFFTLQEANEALAQIRPWMDELQAIRLNILARQPEVWPVVERSAGNGGSQAANKVVGVRAIDLLFTKSGRPARYLRH